MEYKVDPLRRFAGDREIIVGISYEERHRKHAGIAPLVDLRLDRQGCVGVLKERGFPVPPRSRCFICPFQSWGEWQALRHEHPELFCRAVELERRAGVTFKGRPLEKFLRTDRGELFGEEVWQKNLWPSQG